MPRWTTKFSIKDDRFCADLVTQLPCWFESYHLPGNKLEQTRIMQNPSALATQRDSKNDSIFGARREMQAPHDAMHRARMGATDGQSNWPEMRKTLRKPGFLSGEDRDRTFGCFPDVFGQFERQSPWNRSYRSGTWIICLVARE